MADMVVIYPAKVFVSECLSAQYCNNNIYNVTI